MNHPGDASRQGRRRQAAGGARNSRAFARVGLRQLLDAAWTAYSRGRVGPVLYVDPEKLELSDSWQEGDPTARWRSGPGSADRHTVS